MSYRYLAEKADINSAPFFKFVIEGKRNLTKSTLLEICAALGLEDKEAEYFEHLISFECGFPDSAARVDFQGLTLKALLEAPLKASGRRTMSRDVNYNHKDPWIWSMIYNNQWHTGIARTGRIREDLEGNVGARGFPLKLNFPDASVTGFLGMLFN